MNNLQQYNKALVVVLGAILVPLASNFGLDLSNEVIQSLVMLLTAAAVYFVENKKVTK